MDKRSFSNILEAKKKKKTYVHLSAYVCGRESLDVCALG